MKLWLRLYTEVLNDPKVQKLDGNSFKFWINLLCCAKEYSNDGILPDIEGIAFHLRIKEDAAQKYLEKMIESGLVEIEANTYIIHGWSTRQYESDNDPTALDRKRRERDRKRGVTEMSRVTSRTCHGNVTPTEPEQIPDTDTEKKEEAPQASPVCVPRFKKPTVDEVRAYCQERRNRVDPQAFVDFYESKGWKIGKNPMKDWQASVRTWEKREDKPTSERREIDYPEPSPPPPVDEETARKNAEILRGWKPPRRTV